MRQLREVRMGRFCLRLLTLCGMLIATLPAFAGTSASVLPTGLSFAPQKAGTVSTTQVFTVYNIGSTTVTVTSITSSATQFVITGTFPVTINTGQFVNFPVTFNPTTAKAYAGSATVMITGLPNQKVTFNGTGTSSTAIATLSQKSLTFASQPLGTSTSQALTITNTGTTSFKVTGVTLTFPFSQTGFSGTSTTIAPAKSLTIQLAFFPTSVGVAEGTMQIVYDSLAPAGVSLSGTGAAATALTVSNYHTLPSATVSSAYQANLAAAGGTAPYTWALASGSTLPLGLTLSSSGVISGTLDSTVTTGSYSFTGQVTDNKSATASAPLTLQVYKATGSKCNTIVFNAADGTGTLIPINDLGTGSSLGAEEGGLYANGTNVRPSDHDPSGATLAQGIQPLDSNGNPSPTGKYVFIAIGDSIAQQPFFEFTALAGVDPSVNPNLVVVNGATGGATASLLALPNTNFWNVIMHNYLPNAGGTAKQVVAAWVNDLNVV